jgi:hypothetical protein
MIAVFVALLPIACRSHSGSRLTLIDIYEWFIGGASLQRLLFALFPVVPSRTRGRIIC